MPHTLKFCFRQSAGRVGLDLLQLSSSRNERTMSAMSIPDVLMLVLMLMLVLGALVLVMVLVLSW